MMKHTLGSKASRPPGLDPPRFGMRTLLTLITVCCIVFASFSAAGPLVGSAVLLACLVVLAHVAGNVLGTQLRGSSRRSAAEADPSRRPRGRQLREADFAPATQLSRRTPLGWPWMIVTAVGSLSSAVAGGYVLTRYSETAVTLPTVTFASLAAGVLGGFFTFGIFSLAQVFLSAMWQAHGQAQERR